MSRSASPKEKIVGRRLKSIAYLWYGGLDPLYKRLPGATRTAALVVQTGEAGPDLAAALRTELGPDAWAFITGATDEIRDRRQAA